MVVKRQASNAVVYSLTHMKHSELIVLNQVAQDTVAFALPPLPVFTITLFISSLVTFHIDVSATLRSSTRWLYASP